LLPVGEPGRCHGWEILVKKGGACRGPLYNAEASAIGAQTERRGLAGPVRDLLGGETSPAAIFSSLFM
jgi:hypothetical protein